MDRGCGGAEGGPGRLPNLGSPLGGLVFCLGGRGGLGVQGFFCWGGVAAR